MHDGMDFVARPIGIFGINRRHCSSSSILAESQRDSSTNQATRDRIKIINFEGLNTYRGSDLSTPGLALKTHNPGVLIGARRIPEARALT